ncbi:PPRC1 [Lepeophtheirus salmonis]|uniref:PPRC1 n=1 Tax=Lepeophtheirus salmonis TaxID=72036 RepID=A0A7R8CEP3_LEPSM|nr:PPRC1 [Lepeophtheirus salmonis]CAF2797432.1 PPRC1 [Lepeophtheirus salmonis]
MSIFDTLGSEDFDHHNSLIDEFLDLTPTPPSMDLVSNDPIVTSTLNSSSNSFITESNHLGWDQDVLLSNAVLPELNPLLEMGESAEEDFQKMLNEWESHLGSIPESNNSVADVSNEVENSLPGSEDLFHYEDNGSKDRAPQEARMTIGRKTLAGIVISSGPGGYFETYEVLEASDVDNLLQQFEANEDSLLTPNSGGEGVTPKIVRSQRIKDALPVEIIEKIKASSQRSKTIAIIEPLTSKTARDNSIESSGSRVPKSSGIESRFKEAACNLNRNKLRQLGITQSPQQVQKVSLDHDYCSPSKPKRGNKQAQNKLIIASSQVISRRDSDNRKDSGLESGDVSDASDSSSSGNVKGGLKPGLYSKLPPYLTTLKSQKQSNKAFVPVLDGTGNSYDRLPPYIKGIRKTIPVFDKPVPTTTGTTTIAGRSAIPPRQYRQNMKSPPPHLRSSSSSSSSSASSPSSSSSSSEDEYSSSRRRRQHRRKRRRSVSSDSISSGSSRRISSSSSRRRRDESRGRRRSSSRSSISRSRSRRSRDRFSVDRRHDQKRRGDDRVYSERKVVYVGKIKEGTTRADIRKRFESFGPIEEISVHFRDRGDNYGFVTFKYRSDAYNAIEHGNDNPSLPKVDLCFGGRRTFCKEKYSDLDSLNNSESAVGYSALDLDYDLLLKKARGQIKKN